LHTETKTMLYKSISPFDYEGYEPDASVTGEKALLAELLMQAVRDIIDADVGKSSGSDYQRRLAQEWIYDDSENSDTGFTFVQCCDWLGLDARTVRRAIRECLSKESFRGHIERGSRLNSYCIAWRKRIWRDNELPEPGPESGPEPEPESESESESEPEPGPEPESESESGPESGPEPEPPIRLARQP